MGLDTALIQKKEGAERYLDTAWTMQIVRYCIICSGVFLCAPYAALYFEMPEVSNVIRALAIAQFVRGFRNIGPIYFRKNMQFNAWFGYTLIPVAVDFAISIPAAMLFHNVWALVFGLIGRELIGFTLSYVMHPYRPGVNFDYEKFKEIFHFGKWILGAGILSFIVVQGPFVIIAKMIGAAALGTYQMAHRIAVVTMMEMVKIVANSVFPAFALIQDDTIRSRQAYVRVSRLVIFILLPALFCIVLLSRPFTVTVLGEKWTSVIPILQLLALSGVLRALVDTQRPYLIARGTPHLQFNRDLVFAIATLLFIFPLTAALGLGGAAVSQILAAASVLAFDAVYLRKKEAFFGGALFGGIGNSVSVIISAGFGAMAIWACTRFINDQEAFFVLSAFAGILVYAGVQFFQEKMGKKAVLHDIALLIRQRAGSQ